MVGGLLRSGGARGALKVVVASTTGPASYTSGGFTYTVDELKEVYGAIVQASGGYKAEVASISGNTITIMVYQYDYAAAAAGPAIEVTAGTDLSGVTFTILALGGI